MFEDESISVERLRSIKFVMDEENSDEDKVEDEPEVIITSKKDKKKWVLGF